DGDHIVDSRGHSALPGGVVPPGFDSAIGTQGQTVILASGYSNDIAQSWRYCCLAKSGVTPGEHCAGGLQCQIMVATCGDSGEVAQVGRRGGLLILIVTPRHQSSVRAESESVFVASSDGNDVGKAERWDCGNIARAIIIHPPASHRSDAKRHSRTL